MAKKKQPMWIWVAVIAGALFLFSGQLGNLLGQQQLEVTVEVIGGPTWEDEPEIGVQMVITNEGSYTTLHNIDITTASTPPDTPSSPVEGLRECFYTDNPGILPILELAPLAFVTLNCQLDMEQFDPGEGNEYGEPGATPTPVTVQAAIDSDETDVIFSDITNTQLLIWHDPLARFGVDITISED